MKIEKPTARFHEIIKIINDMMENGKQTRKLVDDLLERMVEKKIAESEKKLKLEKDHEIQLLKMNKGIISSHESEDIEQKVKVIARSEIRKKNVHSDQSIGYNW